MKKLILFCFISFLGTAISQAQNLKPYTIGAETTGSISEVANKVKEKLKENGFSVLGEYQPAEDNNRWAIAITSSDLKSAVQKIGGFTGFALALRVGITKEEDKVIVSYTTPEYWGNAYFRNDYSKVESLYAAFSSKLKAALSSLGTDGGTAFGSKDGHSIDKLRKYHYMFAMPYFDDNIELNEFKTYEAAIAKIDDNLSKGVTNLKKVYSIELPGQKIKLYGIGVSGENGEASFLSKIDVATPKSTPFLPYEMLVLKNKVYMLHGRFRIALSFPDLKLGQFMKISSTPKDIKNLLKKATEAK